MGTKVSVIREHYHRWMTNHCLGDDSDWVGIPTSIQPPVLLRAEFAGWGITFKQEGPPENLVKHALRHAWPVTVPNLRATYFELGIGLPQGTGKKGAHLKMDLVNGLLLHFWPDDSDAELRQKLAEQMAGMKKTVFDECSAEAVCFQKS